MQDLEADVTRFSALAAKRTGWEVAFVRWGGKGAVDDEWQTRRPTLAEIDYRMRKRRLNYGLILNTEGYRALVVDRDAADPAALAWMEGSGIASAMEVRSPRGLHVYGRLDDCVTDVRSRIKYLGMPLDLKMTGYMMGPGSWNEELACRYEIAQGKRLLCPGDLPVLLPGERLPEPERQETTERPAVRCVIDRTRHMARRIGNPEAYALRVESHEGSGGSRGLVRVVSCLRDSGWDPGRIYRFLVEEWNRPPRVTPVWPEEDLARAVRRHAGDF
jgi:hypothetical protein